MVPENDELNTLSMNILVHAGSARDFFVKALAEIEKKEFNEAKETIQKAKEEVVIAHGLQTETLQKEASGEQVRYSTLFCHAQDTLMTVQSEILIGEHLVKLFESLSKK